MYLRVAAVLGATLVVIGFLIKFAGVCKDFCVNVYNIASRIKHISEELSPNGGGSIKDAVSRIEKRQESMEKRQLMTEQRERAVLQESPISLFESAPDGSLIWVNKALMQLTGRHAQDLLGFGWENTVLESERIRVRETWQGSIDRGRDHEDVHTIVVPNGGQFVVSVRAYAIRDSKNQISGWFGIIRKVS